MIRHVFAWKVVDQQDAGKVIELLTEYSASQEAVRHFEIGGHTGDPGDNGDPWDGVLITDFDDWEGLQVYSDHPDHVKLVEVLLPMVKERAVIDFVRQEGVTRA
ncbi:Dabb family protein [Mycolicibacterium wolinskyi]|uniref:Stress protein n=1 Tax=Mycolicibacterium wolinskyi TaxID=59750 RepID=A0A132PKW1_9MYCO|nr:Dabb family protein [Mycolicibacterium wolinskyi]KWX22981.1 stress protein [Mycolicibacterium wolinskyi]